MRGREGLHAVDLLIRKLMQPLGGQRSEVDVGWHAIRVETERFLTTSDRFRQPSQFDEYLASRTVRFGVIWLESDRLAVVFFRLLELPLFDQCVRKVIVGLGAVGA